MNTLQELNSSYDHLYDRNLFITYTDQYPRLSVIATSDFTSLSVTDRKRILVYLWQNTRYLGIFVHDAHHKLLASININCIVVCSDGEKPTVYSNTYKKTRNRQHANFSKKLGMNRHMTQL